MRRTSHDNERHDAGNAMQAADRHEKDCLVERQIAALGIVRKRIAESVGQRVVGAGRHNLSYHF